MRTVYDWASVILFSAIALTYLQRSISPPQFSDRIVKYLPPTFGCALANWLGNEGHGELAIATIAASALWFWHFIKPLRR